MLDLEAFAVQGTRFADTCTIHLSWGNIPFETGAGPVKKFNLARRGLRVRAARLGSRSGSLWL